MQSLKKKQPKKTENTVQQMILLLLNTANCHSTDLAYERRRISPNSLYNELIARQNISKFNLT